MIINSTTDNDEVDAKIQEALGDDDVKRTISAGSKVMITMYENQTLRKIGFAGQQLEKFETLDRVYVQSFSIVNSTQLLLLINKTRLEKGYL